MMAMTLLDSAFQETVKASEIKKLDVLIAFREFVSQITRTLTHELSSFFFCFKRQHLHKAIIAIQESTLLYRMFMFALKRMPTVIRQMRIYSRIFLTTFYTKWIGFLAIATGLVCIDI